MVNSGERRIRRIVIIGAGGFAREVKWLIEDLNRVEPRYDFLGYVVSDVAALTERDSRSEVLGDFSWLLANQASVDALAIGIGSGAARLKVSEELEKTFPPDRWPSLVHPKVVFDRSSCSFGHGTIVCAGTIATVNVRFAPYAMVNLACTLGHEAELGRGCVLNPTVNISGGVRIGDGALIGTGAQVLQYVRIGAGSTVGAGAVVTKDVPDGQTVVGIPAKPK